VVVGPVAAGPAGRVVDVELADGRDVVERVVAVAAGPAVVVAVATGAGWSPAVVVVAASAASVSRASSADRARGCEPVTLVPTRCTPCQASRTATVAAANQPSP
jgi:hypothetical protein